VTTPLQGNLKDHNLTRILVELNNSRATGTLAVSNLSFTKSIYLKGGEVIFASSTFEDDRLGEMLVKSGHITMEQYDKSVELLKTSGKRLGQILVDLGHITSKDLFWGLKFQVKEIIYSLFQMEDGGYEFHKDAAPPYEVITLKISMDNLIYEGVKRIDNLTRIRRELPDVHTVLMLNKDPIGIFKRIDLSEEDRWILSLVDGKRTINQLLEESHVNSFDVMKTLFVLWSTGFIIEKGLSTPGGEETIEIKGKVGTMTEEHEALRKKVEGLYNKISDTDPSELLQVNEQMGADEIKRNYYRLAKEFHPDRVHNFDDEVLKNKISTIFDAMTKAYNLLKDDGKRAEFFYSLGKVHKKREDTQDTQTAIFEEQFNRGVEEFKKGNFWGAVELFRLVTRNTPKNPKAWSYLSLSLSKIPNRIKEAEEALLEAIKLEPFKSEHFANLGSLYLKAGLIKRAKHQFEKAMRLDPENEKAKKGLEQEGEGSSR
jgi:curved DNA-binding protein CbpA